MSENANPKIEGNQQGTRDNYKKSYGKSRDAFRGPTTGLEDVVFKYLLSSMNASTMKNNCDHLAEHIGIHFKKGASVAEKAMREEVSMVYVEPAEPKIELVKTIGLVEKVKLDRALNRYFEDMEVWTNLNARIYNFLLSHCNVGMRDTMIGLNGWDAVSLTQYGMRYRELLEGVYHGQDGTRQGMAEAVNLEAKLCTTYQYTNQSDTDYVDNYLSVVDYVRIARCLPGHIALAYVVYAKSVGCNDFNALDVPNREMASQRYLNAPLFRRLKNRYFLN